VVVGGRRPVVARSGAVVAARLAAGWTASCEATLGKPPKSTDPATSAPSQHAVAMATSAPARRTSRARRPESSQKTGSSPLAAAAAGGCVLVVAIVMSFCTPPCTPGPPRCGAETRLQRHNEATPAEM
jgi:hypothetical protein